MPAATRHLRLAISCVLGLAFVILPGAAAEAPPAAPSSAATPTTAAAHVETKAERDLRTLVTQEKAIWDRLRAQPDDAGLQLRANTEFRDVLLAYENILRASPEFAEAYAAYGLLLSRTGNREDATLAFMRANKLNPNIALVKNQLGNFLLEEGNYKEALPYYLAAIALEPNEPLYHYQLGTLLHEFRRLLLADEIFTAEVLESKTQAAFRRAAELGPDTWGYTYRYAESFYDLAKPEWGAALAAWQALEQKAKPGLEAQTVQLHLARVLIALDQRDEARAILDAVTDPLLARTKQTVVEMLEPPPAE